MLESVQAPYDQGASSINVWVLDLRTFASNRLEAKVLKCLDIHVSAYEIFFDQMHISGYVWKFLSLQGFFSCFGLFEL